MSVEAVLCIWIIGVGFLVAELFVPGMIMGAIGAVAIIVSIAAMFMIEGGGALWGGGLTVGSLIFAGVLIKVGAARLTSKHTLTSEEGYAGTDDHQDLVGQEGVTATVLRPGGFANIGGKRIDVVTGGEMLDPGVAVVVVAAEGNRIQVRQKE